MLEACCVCMSANNTEEKTQISSFDKFLVVFAGKAWKSPHVSINNNHRIHFEAHYHLSPINVQQCYFYTKVSLRGSLIKVTAILNILKHE